MNEYKWNIVIGVWFVALGVMVVTSVISGLSNNAKNDACLEAGGVYVSTYDGYKCYSTDFRQVLTVE